MKTAEINVDELELWRLAFSIRSFIEDRSYYYGTNPLPDIESITLVSSVEQIFLTEGMVLSFLRESEPIGMFAADLRKWGVIQALVVQQDAVDFLARILNAERLNPSKHPKLKIIRDDLRNRYVGHPVRSQDEKKFVVTAASHSMEACFIEIKAEGMEVRRFDLRSAIDTQKDVLKVFLTNLKSKAMETEEEFRTKLRAARPLEIIRNSTFGYHLDKAHPEPSGMQLYHSKEIQNQIELVKRAFSEVGRFSGMIQSDLASMDYAAAEVVNFYESIEEHRRLAPPDIDVFLAYLGHRYDRLITYADQIGSDIEHPPA